MEKVLVIAAHPDDEVLGMGGTIARLASEGKEIHLLIITDGSTAQYANDPNLKTILNNKFEETAKAASILGVSTVDYGELLDMKLDCTPHVEINHVIESAINKYSPDTVFTHFWGDVNKDHCCVYESTIVATRPTFSQVVRNLYCYKVPSSTEWTPHHYPTMFMPTVFIDISEYAEQKYKAMLAYHTELREFPHPRSIEYLRKTEEASGLRCGRKAVEEFVLLRQII